MLPGELCLNENIFSSLIKDVKLGYFFNYCSLSGLYMQS